jgi:hypothetical protein
VSEPELISRDELTAYLFNVADIHDDVATIRRILEGDDDGRRAEEEP